MSETDDTGHGFRRILLVAIAAAVVGALITFAFVAHPDLDDDDDEEQVTSSIESSPSSPVSLGAALADENGIEVEALVISSAPLTETALGVVADVSALIDLVRRDEALTASIDEARARNAASSAEEERVAQLNADDRNASDHALELARSEAAKDQAALDTLRSEQQALHSTASRRWGSLATSVLEGSASSAAILAGRTALLEIALPAGVNAPDSLMVSPPGGEPVEAQLLSVAPRVDPQLQQQVCLYSAPAAGLPTGARVSAAIPTEGTSEGVVVPRSAVVWREGSAWVFVETGPGVFDRRRIDATRVVDDGYFESGMSGGLRVVTRGAQQLLSQQYKPQAED